MVSGRLVHIWGCTLVVALALAASNGAPTESSDTLVVTADPVPETAKALPLEPMTDPKQNEANTVSTSSTTLTPEVSSEPTTEAPILPLKVTSMNVTSDITVRYAHTTVLTAMRNPAHRAQEATFSIILPETAFITGFTMILDGKPYKAYVKEKEEAKNIYTNAVNSGQAAAHIAAKARDSNHFTVSVNIEPTTKAIFNLTYEELLIRRLDVYNHVINLNPGRVIPQLNVEVNIKEGRKIKTLRVPELRTGNEIDAQDTDKANEFAKIEKNGDGKEAKITFSPNIEQQTALMQLYKERSKEKIPKRDPDFYPSFISHTDNAQEDGVLGQFVVQYDVERDPHNGEIMVNDGYFVHFFAPTDLKPLNKHVIFVLDTSGSMAERKIEQLREAMVTILGELNPGDYFNIVEFSYNARVYDLGNVSEHKQLNHDVYDWQPTETPTLQPLVAPSPATKANVDIAQNIVRTLEARGGTNIDEAVVTALRLANAGVQQPDSKVADLPNTDLQGASTQATDTKDEKPSKPEPIIIFLTDGDPTIGETRPEKILSKVAELNSGNNKAAIFSLAFGEDADRDFLKKLSLRNAGFMRHIYEAADASSQLHHFYRQVASPLLSHVRFVYPDDEVEKGSLTKASYHTLFSGSELVVAGKVSSKDKKIRPTVSALSLRGPIDFIPRPPKEQVPHATCYQNLERLWAYVTIQQLLDEKDSQPADVDKDEKEDDTKKEDKKKETPEKRALRLALQYSFVTPLTSLVVVKPNATSAVDAESVDKVQPFGYPLGVQAMYQLSGPPSAVGGFPGAGFAQSTPYSYRGSSGAMPGAPLYARPDNSPLHFQTVQDIAYEEDDVLDSIGHSSSPMRAKLMLGMHGRLLSRKGGHRIVGGAQDNYAGASFISDRSTFPVQYESADALLPMSPLPGQTYVPNLSNFGGPVEQSFADPILILSTTTVPNIAAPSNEDTSRPNPLVQYKLEHYSWLEPYVNASADVVTLPLKSGNVTLKLTKNEKVAISSLAVSCAVSVSGVSGVCRYLPSCAAAKEVLTNLEQYEKYFCDNNGYAGVCCPETA